MKPFVVFYSRTGNTKQIGETLAQLLACDREELVDTKKRSGALGFVSAGRDAKSKNLTKLANLTHDPALYDLVILGTPIWGGTLSSAIRSYIVANKAKFKRVAFFCTHGGSENIQLFDEMAALCEKRPIDTLAISQEEIKNGTYQEKLRQFAYKLD